MLEDPDDIFAKDMSEDGDTGEEIAIEELKEISSNGRYPWGHSADGKPRIHRRIPVRAMTLLRQELGRGGLSGIFRRGDDLVYTPMIGESGYVLPKHDGDDDGPAQIQSATDKVLTEVIEMHYDTGYFKQDSKGAWYWVQTNFPFDLALRVAVAGKVGIQVPNLGTLRGVTHTPCVRQDGSILDTPGYDKASRHLYLPTGDALLPVPDNPTVEDLAEAREILMYPIAQFPFVTDDDRANWLGYMLAPLLRLYVPPPYPMLLLDAPSPGSGKTLLANLYQIVHGAVLRAMFPDQDAEVSKVIMGVLQATTAPFVVFDNVTGRLGSPVLEGVLTSADFSDRLLGRNDTIISVRNDRLWVVTSNNAQVRGDLARRVLRSTIDPGIEHPEARTGFRCNPPVWMEEHRAEYLRALLVITRAWGVAGRPVRPVERSDSYSKWIQVIRGVLEHAGVPGIFANRAARVEIAAEDEEWARFLHSIYDLWCDHTFTARELCDVIGTVGAGQIHPDMLPSDLAAKWTDNPFSGNTKLTRSLGRWLVNRSGRWAGGRTVRCLGAGTSGGAKNVNQFRVEAAGDDARSRPGSLAVADSM
jgi:hypothetical protein